MITDLHESFRHLQTTADVGRLLTITEFTHLSVLSSQHLYLRHVSHSDRVKCRCSVFAMS